MAGAFCICTFLGKFAVHFLAVVEVVAEGGVDFAQREVRVLQDHFFR